MLICDRVQNLLAEDGADAVGADSELRRHLESCGDCNRVAEALERLDAALQTLPEHDAPEAVVSDSLRAVRHAAEGEARGQAGNGARRQLAGALAASVVLVASFGLAYDLMDRPAYRNLIDRGWLDRESARVPMAELAAGSSVGAYYSNLGQPSKPTAAPTGGRVSSSEISELDDLGARHSSADPGTAGEPARGENRPAPTGPATSAEAATERPKFALAPPPEPVEARLGREAELIARLQMQRAPAKREEKRAENQRLAKAKVKAREERARRFLGGDKRQSKDRDYRAAARSFGAPRSSVLKSLEKGAADANVSERGAKFGKILDDDLSHLHRSDNSAAAADEEATEEFQKRPPNASKEVVAKAKQDLDRQRLGASTSATGQIVDALRLTESEPVASNEGFVDEKRWRGIRSAVDPEAAARQARAFLRRITSLDGLSFQSPTGYWSNTYVPGDPDMRLIGARLRDWDRRPLGRQAQLEQTVRPVSQLFDAPESAALSLYLHADSRAIQGPTRLRVQVGLKGAERRGGHRPAMNVGLVVDLSGLGEKGLVPRVRALVTALERARQPGDRFSLTVTGPSGGMVVAPESFRHGPLKVALARLLAGPEKPTGPMTGLAAAISIAAANVRQSEQADAILGASLVVLATGASLAQDLEALEGLAHENAIGGVPMSVVGLGRGVSPEHVERLVAAGQGSRRFLTSAEGAEALIDRELHAASRAVARAVRLRIRLAPGVKLVDILGSRRLDQPQAQRVRQTERAIDRRLARNLGIEADRGQDEEGIQIVIPNFHAGDSHVVLLDVVAERPGPIAEVTARYKDVVHLKNGVAHARLTIEAGERQAGPMQRNVLKNLLAWELARQARRLSRYFEAGRESEAALITARLRSLIHGLRQQFPGWSTDPDLAADEAMLANYLAVLGSPSAGDPVQRRYLADSLRYAAFSKLHTAK